MMSGTSEAEATSGKQNGETFNEEMKDYAKSTMNELLGMFGYEEEITREAVEELQIKLLPEADEQPRTNVFNNTAELEKNHSEVPSAEETPYVVQIPGTENDNVARVLPSSAVNNAANPVQPLPKTAVNPSVPSDTNKPGTALAPHFLAEPPNVKGVYCVVANLPVVNSGCKTNMTFKFWNCIMCSEYFVQKPEVVFRVEHPHLFGSHPAWLYQAAVCQKCHQSLNSSKNVTLTASASQDVSSAFCGVNSAGIDQENGTSLSTQVMVTKSGSHAPESNVGVSMPNSLESTSSVEVPSTATTTTEKDDTKNVTQVFFDCYICSKPVYKNSRHGKMRRSKYPTLFSNLPESVGYQRVCFTCSERLTRQRDRYVHAGIAEEDRDYAAHIKIWTGKDFTSKLSSPTTKNSDCSTCFVCEKYIPPNVNQEVKTLNRTRFPSLFSAVPGQIIKLLICDSCHRKLLKVKSRFDENNTVEEERDYWVYINSWRDRKGLENHLYSTHYP